MSVSQQPSTIACHVRGTDGVLLANFGFVSAVRNFLGNYTLTIPPQFAVMNEVFITMSLIGSTGREAYNIGLGLGPPAIATIVVWADAGGAAAVDRDFKLKIERMIS